MEIKLGNIYSSFQETLQNVEENSPNRWFFESSVNIMIWWMCIRIPFVLSWSLTFLIVTLLYPTQLPTYFFRSFNITILLNSSLCQNFVLITGWPWVYFSYGSKQCVYGRVQSLESASLDNKTSFDIYQLCT